MDDNKVYFMSFDPEKCIDKNMPSGISMYMCSNKGEKYAFDENGKAATDRHPVTLEKLDEE